MHRPEQSVQRAPLLSLHHQCGLYHQRRSLQKERGRRGYSSSSFPFDCPPFLSLHRYITSLLRPFFLRDIIDGRNPFSRIRSPLSFLYNKLCHFYTTLPSGLFPIAPHLLHPSPSLLPLPTDTIIANSFLKRLLNHSIFFSDFRWSVLRDRTVPEGCPRDAEATDSIKTLSSASKQE